MQLADGMKSTRMTTIPAKIATATMTMTRITVTAAEKSQNGRKQKILRSGRFSLCVPCSFSTLRVFPLKLLLISHPPALLPPEDSPNGMPKFRFRRLPPSILSFSLDRLTSEEQSGAMLFRRTGEVPGGPPHCPVSCAHNASGSRQNPGGYDEPPDFYRYKPHTQNGGTNF